MKKAFRDAWDEFDKSSQGYRFKRVLQGDQITIAKDYMRDLPKVEDFPSGIAPGIAARGWFACYLEKMANREHAGAEQIKKAFD